MKRSVTRKLCMAVFLIFFLQFFTYATLGIVAVEASPSSSEMDYVFMEGTGSPYDIMFDTTDGAGPFSVVETENWFDTGFSGQRKLALMSNGTLYGVYKRNLAGLYQIFVKKSNDDGATWTDETRISTAGGMAGYSMFGPPTIAVDSNDYLHVTFGGKATSFSTKNHIWYTNYTTSWSTPVRISTDAIFTGYSITNNAIAVDSNDYLHVTFGGKATPYPSYDQVWYLNYTTSWGDPIRISTYLGMDSNLQQYASIAVNGDDTIHFIWFGQATGYGIAQIWYRKYSVSTSMGEIFRINTDAGMDTLGGDGGVIAVDSNDFLHVSWSGRSTSQPTNLQIWHRNYTTSWGDITRVSTYAGMSTNHQYYPSIGVDSNDYIHILWYGKATGLSDFNKVWHGLHNGSWQTPVCLQPTGQNQYPNLRWSRWPEPPLAPPYGLYVTIDNMEGCGNWVFAEERYYEFNATYLGDPAWNNIGTAKIKFTDGYNTIIVSYDVSSEAFSIESGSDVIILSAGTVKNVTSTRLSVTFDIYFKNTILDAYDVDIFQRALNATEDSGWVEKATDYFNIYCLGGRAEMTATGNAGRSLGGDVYDLYAGGGYTPADIFEDNFAGEEFIQNWYEYEPGTNEITIDHTIFYPGQEDYHSAKITAKTTDYWAWLEGDFGTQETNFTIQLYIYMPSVTDGSSQIGVWSNTTNIANLIVFFGYGTDLDQIWCTDGAGFYNTTEIYAVDTWYKVKIENDVTNEQYDLYIDDVLVADDMDYQNGDPYFPRYLRVVSVFGTVDRVTYADVVTVWKGEAGSYGGTAEVVVYYRKLQHVQMQFSVKIPDGDYILNTDLPNEMYVELGLEFCYNDDWIEGAKVRITPLGGQSTGENQWVYLWTQWFYNDTQIYAKGIYTYWEGASGSKDQFSLWFDSWVNLVNASTTFGSRVNTVYYGVEDTSNPWLRWWTGEDWGIMGQENDESMFFGDLEDLSGNVISCKTFDLMRFRVKIYRSANHDYTVELGDFNSLGFIRTLQDMRGVATPPYNRPSMPTLPQGGLGSQLVDLFSRMTNDIVNSLTKGTLSFWPVFVGFLDTIFGFAGWHNGFSAIVSWISSFLSWMVTGISYAITLLTSTFQLMASWLVFAIVQFASLAIGFIVIYDVLMTIWSEANSGWLDLSSWVTPLLPLLPLALFFWIFSVNDIEGVFRRVKILWDLLRTTIIFLIQIGHYVFDLITGLINIIPVIE